MDRRDTAYGFWWREMPNGNVLEIGGAPGDWFMTLTGHGYRMQSRNYPYRWMAKLAFPILRHTYRGVY